MWKIGEEKRIENSIKEWLETNNWFFLKVQGGANNPSAGVPDVLACVKGTFVGIEVKTPTGVTSKLQLYQIDRINKSGGVAVVVTSLEQLRMELKNRNII